jgi:hypothetical protein
LQAKEQKGSTRKQALIGAEVSERHPKAMTKHRQEHKQFRRRKWWRRRSQSKWSQGELAARESLKIN